MTTYASKIRKYRARIEEARQMGREPRKTDVERLLYYVGCAGQYGEDAVVRKRDRLAGALERVAAKVELGSEETLPLEAVLRLLR